MKKQFMKKTFKKQFVLLFAGIGFILPSMAQDSARTSMTDDGMSKSATVTPVKPFTGAKQFRTWSIGLNGGALMPVIAVGGSNDFTKWEPTLGYGAYLKAQLNHTFGLQAEFLKGILKANNENLLGNGTVTSSPYSSFKTQLNWTASVSATATLANLNFLHRQNVILPYVTLGAGLVDYNPTLVMNDKTIVDYKPDGSIKEFFIPVGAGVKAKLGNGVNLDLGYRMNFVDGDNLDGYSNGTHKDKFSYAMVGLEFALGSAGQQQLAFNNPASDLQLDLQDQNDALKASLAASIAANEQSLREKTAQMNAMKDELDKMKKDADGDGVSDYFDKCAGTPATEKVDGAGCPLPKAEVAKPAQTIIITEEDKRVVNEAIKDLQFETGKATLRSTSFASLDRVADLLVSKNFSLKLAGHTDNVGSDNSNLKLSKDRAESVKAYLVSKGANPSRIEATGYGETQPITSNKTDAGRQKNRRVEFTLY